MLSSVRVFNLKPYKISYNIERQTVEMVIMTQGFMKEKRTFMESYTPLKNPHKQNMTTQHDY